MSLSKQILRKRGNSYIKGLSQSVKSAHYSQLLLLKADDHTTTQFGLRVT